MTSEDLTTVADLGEGEKRGTSQGCRKLLEAEKGKKQILRSCQKEMHFCRQLDDGSLRHTLAF